VKNNAGVISIDRGKLYLLWDFLSVRGENVIIRWARDERLTKRDRAALNNRLTRLSQIDFQAAIDTKLLAGPIYKQVYKLKIYGDVMLRPMLCRGPINNLSEYTLLLGAIEIGGKLPKGVKEKAEENRKEIIKNPARRKLHERIP
jgi:hypothetical protein